jgi:ferredoxin
MADGRLHLSFFQGAKTGQLFRASSLAKGVNRMRARVNQTKCKTVGTCVQRCPQVFSFETGSKKARAIEGEIPKKMESRCMEASRQCPEGAIEIIIEK